MAITKQTPYQFIPGTALPNTTEYGEFNNRVKTNYASYGGLALGTPNNAPPYSDGFKGCRAGIVLHMPERHITLLHIHGIGLSDTQQEYLRIVQRERTPQQHSAFFMIEGNDTGAANAPSIIKDIESFGIAHAGNIKISATEGENWSLACRPDSLSLLINVPATQSIYELNDIASHAAQWEAGKEALGALAKQEATYTEIAQAGL